jgi:hypothetical protein
LGESKFRTESEMTHQQTGVRANVSNGDNGLT